MAYRNFKPERVQIAEAGCAVLLLQSRCMADAVNYRKCLQVHVGSLARPHVGSSMKPGTASQLFKQPL
jgi:hypothetical protein